MKEKYSLPEDWKWVKLGEVCEINPKDSSLKDLPDTLEVTFVPMAAVDEEEGAIVAPQIRQLKQVRKGYTQFKEGDVIFAKITPCMENGKAAIARNLKNGLGFGSTEFHVLRPTSQAISEYIYFYVRQPSFRNEAKMNMTGTAGQLRVPVKFVKNVSVPLPHLEEQKRIVAVLESALSRVNKAKELLEESGKAIEKILPAAIKKAIPTEDPLPEGWRWVKLGDVADEVKSGFPCGSYKMSGKIIHIRPMNISETGEFSFDEIKYVEECLVEDIEKYTLKPGDVVFNNTNSVRLIGKTAVFKSAPNDLKCVFSNHMTRIRVKNAIMIPEILSTILHKMWREGYFTLVCTKHVNQASVSTKPLLNLKIPLPPLEEQKRIVTHLKEISNKVGTLKELHKQATERVEKITASILAKAFRGEL